MLAYFYIGEIQGDSYIVPHFSSETSVLCKSSSSGVICPCIAKMYQMVDIALTELLTAKVSFQVIHESSNISAKLPYQPGNAETCDTPSCSWLLQGSSALISPVKCQVFVYTRAQLASTLDWANQLCGSASILQIRVISVLMTQLRGDQTRQTQLNSWIS